MKTRGATLALLAGLLCSLTLLAQTKVDPKLPVYKETTGVSGKLKSTGSETNSSGLSRHVTLARIMYEGNADPEPGAWPRFARIMRSRGPDSIDLQVLKLAGLVADMQAVLVRTIRLGDRCLDRDFLLLAVGDHLAAARKRRPEFRRR